MKEKTFKWVSLLCSITGLVVLYIGATQMQPTTVAIASLNNEYVGKKVTISGRVIDLFDHEDGHLFLKLKDDSGGVISVPIFSKTRAGLNEMIELLDQVKVTGIVDEYKGELEVVPGKAEDMEITHAAPAPLSSLGQENLGELVKVEGTISKREVVGSGNLILTLQEDGHELSVFVPQWVVTDGLPELHTGYKIRVTGWVQLYGNELEVRVKEAPHLRVVTG